MLQFRIRFLLESKGIVKPYNFLIKNGFTPNVATRCLQGKIMVLKLSQITRLCTILGCTPNDLLEWVPQTNVSRLPETHPLHTLVRNDKPFNIIDQINHLTLDQIKEVEQLIDTMHTKG